jgi:hypothetical protein
MKFESKVFAVFCIVFDIQKSTHAKDILCLITSLLSKFSLTHLKLWEKPVWGGICLIGVSSFFLSHGSVENRIIFSQDNIYYVHLKEVLKLGDSALISTFEETNFFGALGWLNWNFDYGVLKSLNLDSLSIFLNKGYLNKLLRKKLFFTKMVLKLGHFTVYNKIFNKNAWHNFERGQESFMNIFIFSMFFCDLVSNWASNNCEHFTALLGGIRAKLSKWNQYCRILESFIGKKKAVPATLFRIG